MTRLYLEKGKEEGDNIQFVRYVGFWTIDTSVFISRTDWENMGSPDNIRLEVYPA